VMALQLENQTNTSFDIACRLKCRAAHFPQF